MDGFLKDINFMIFIKYIYHKIPCTSFHKDEFGISMSNETLHCSFYFTYDYVVELKREFNEELYYLHFEFINMYESMKLLNDFLDFMTSQRSIKVLVCCSSALTSSYLSAKLNEYIEEHNEKIEITACSYNRIETINNDYDVVLLAPQINYLKVKLLHLHHIVSIPTNIYATYDCKKIIELIKKEYENMC